MSFSIPILKWHFQCTDSDQRSVWVQKIFRKKRTEIYFSIFIANRNWDLKFVFQFDNENEKRKNSNLYFISKQKSNVPFNPRIIFILLTSSF